jgi:hypothetical protein
MKDVIHKHILEPLCGKIQELELPVSARFIAVGAQQNQIVIWERHSVATSAKMKFRVVLVFTGDTVDDSWSHIGTVQTGPIVWHAFAEPNDAGHNLDWARKP